MKPKYRAAVIGCGMIGDRFAEKRAAIGVYSHADAYVACAQTELVAVCDIDPAKSEACATRWNIPARYTSAANLLAEQAPDIVSICTPDETHFDLAMMAMDAPRTRAVLLEKPLATRLGDARVLSARACEREIPLAVNYARRYAASHVALRDAVRSGAIGRCQHVAGFYTKGVVHNGTHWFDLARFLIGDVTRVHGFATRGAGGGDPTLDVRLEFENGATAFLAGCDETAYTVFEMDLLGTAGRIRIVDSGHEFQSFTVTENVNFPGYRTLQRVNGIPGGVRDTTLHAVEDLAACLDDNRQPLCSAADALAALEIALAARDSAVEGRAVEINRK